MESIGFLAGWVAGWAAGWVAGWPSSDPQCPRERASYELRVRVRRSGKAPRSNTTMYSEPLGSIGNLSKTIRKGMLSGWPAGRLAGRGKA